MSTHRRNKAIYAAASLAAVAWLPTGAYAAQPAGQSVAGAIEEVLVTARRREESLQDVPIAISAFGGENLQQRGIESVQSMNAVAPNLSVMGGGNSGESQASFRVRGMPGVSVYIDGVDQPTTDGLLTMGVVEVDRIEVLRGPQGTLFGNGSLGGAVSYVTKAPADVYGARVQATLGSFDRKDIQFSLDLPLSDTFKTKLTGASMTRDGFVTSKVIDRKYGDTNDTLYRADFLWKPFDGFSARYNIEKSDTDRLGPARVVWEIGPTGTRTVGATTFNTNPQVQAYANATRNGNYINGFTNIAYNNANNTSGQPYSTSLGKYDTRVAWETHGIVINNLRHTLDLNWEINDTFRVRGISGYKELKRVTQVDFDGAAEVVLLERLNNTRTNSFSQELQILGSHERVDWVLGGFYQYQNTNGRGVTWGMPEFTCDLWSASNRTGRGITLNDQVNCFNNRARALNRDASQLNPVTTTAGALAAAQPGLAANNPTLQTAALGVNPGVFTAAAASNADTGSLTNSTTKAVFGDVTWRATDKLNVAFGLRKSWDENPGSINLLNHTPSRAGLLPDTDIPNYFGYLQVNSAGTPLPGRLNPSKFDALTKRLTLQYQWSPDLMTYVGYSDGYQPGGTSSVGANILVVTPNTGTCGAGTLASGTSCVGGYMRDIFVNNPAGNDVYGQLNPLVRDEQTVKSFEVGMRADWFGGQLRTNVTAFYTDWENIPVSAYHATSWWDVDGNGFADSQINVDGVPGNDIFFFPSLYTVGVKKAEAKGIELETTWRATDNLRFNLNVGYLKTEYTEVGSDAADFANGGKLPFAAVNAGSIFAGAPELTTNFGTSYEFQLAGGRSITPRLDYTWTDQYTLQTGEVLQRVQEAYGILNARIGYDSGSNWQVALTGSNLTNEYYFNSGFFTKAEQIHFMTVGRPAEYGLQFNFKFE
ncbi:MAG: TonB-dependent receptor [Steroidobacteraceae bacterium]